MQIFTPKRYPKITLAITIFLLANHWAAAQQMIDMTVFTNTSGHTADKFWQVNEDTYHPYNGFMVRGNPMVFRGDNIGDMYTVEGVAKNVPIRLNAENQQIGVVLADKKSEFVFNYLIVDSFQIKSDSSNGNKPSSMFVSGKFFNGNSKSMFERLVDVGTYQLYKEYYIDLKPGEADIAQQNKKVYDIIARYYYTTGQKPDELIKINNNIKKLIKKTKENEKGTDILEDSYYNKETRLIMFFSKYGDMLQAKN